MQACSRESKMPSESRTDWSTLCVHQPPPTASPACVMSGNWQIIRQPRLIRTGDSAQVKRTRWSESKADRKPERATSRRGEREREKHNLWAVNGLIKFEERVQIKSEGKQEVRLLYLSSWKMRKQQQQKKLLVCCRNFGRRSFVWYSPYINEQLKSACVSVC